MFNNDTALNKRIDSIKPQENMLQEYKQMVAVISDYFKLNSPFKVAEVWKVWVSLYCFFF